MRYYTTVVIGPDGRVFDLAKARFPKNSNYIPVSAYPVETDKDGNIKEPGNDKGRG